MTGDIWRGFLGHSKGNVLFLDLYYIVNFYYFLFHIYILSAVNFQTKIYILKNSRKASSLLEVKIDSKKHKKGKVIC